MRHAARRLLPAIGGLLLLGWGASFLTRPAPVAGGTVVGSLAGFDATLAEPWQPVVTLAGDALDGGRILALDERDDTLVLAHPHAVSVVVEGRVHRRFGSDVTGAPEFIARAAGIAIVDSGIALLDAPLHRVDLWSFAGARYARIALPTGTLGAQYGSVAADRGAALVPAFRHGDRDGGWWIFRVTPTGLDTLVARHALNARGAAYRQLLVAPVAAGYAALDALSGWLYALDAAGAHGDSTQRPDPLQYRVPDASRARVRDIAATIPAEMRRALDIGDYAPSARALSATADGRLFVLTGDLDDAMHVEVLAPDGRAVGRLWQEPERAQLFLVRGRVYRIREVEESLVIERQSLTPARQ
jgi:hypothetical protein